MAKKNIRKITGFIHLWLGLIAGLVVFIVSITGALWAFETEMLDIAYSYRNVEPQGKAFVLPSQIKAAAQKAFGGKPVKSICYWGSNKAAEARAWGEDGQGNEYSLQAYINPYTGQMQGIHEGGTFFDAVIDLHTNLMLGDIGGEIVDYATLIFLVMVISGIILWWPHNKARKKSSYKIKWGAPFKRVVYDLHNVPGFYASWVLIFIVITGLAWGFEWVNDSIYGIASGGGPQQQWAEPESTSANDAKTIVLNVDDYCYQNAIKQYAKPFSVSEIYYPSGEEASYTVYINPSLKTLHNRSTYYYDQRSGALLLEESFAKKNGGEKTRSMYYDIHIGKIWGLPGQLLAFFAALIAASLPVTGFLIWLGRKTKKVQQHNETINGMR